MDEQNIQHDPHTKNQGNWAILGMAIKLYKARQSKQAQI